MLYMQFTILINWYVFPGILPAAGEFWGPPTIGGPPGSSETEPQRFFERLEHNLKKENTDSTKASSSEASKVDNRTKMCNTNQKH